MKSKLLIFLMVGVVVAFSAVTPLCAQEGAVNWIEGYVVATGLGAAAKGSLAQARPLAKRAAVADAQRNLLEIIKGVKIDAQTTVENFIVSQDIIKTQVQGVVKGAHITKVSYEPQMDGSLGATVEMRICMNNCSGSDSSLVQALNLDKKDINVPPQLPDTIVAPVQPREPTPKPAKKVYTFDTSKPITGVVFNLEGRNYDKVIMPVVVTTGQDNNFFTVYSAKNVEPRIIRTFGVIRYAESVDNALKQEHIGGNVLIIPVHDITKDNLVVISLENAKTIQDSTRHGNEYLTNARVIIATH